MTITADQIVTEALGLSAQARAFVAERLIESLDVLPGADLSPEWKNEVQRRCKEIDQGAVQLRDADEVFRKAYASLR